jgi:glucose dehydrogenase
VDQSHHQGLREHRYGSLEQINATNVGSLKVVWTFNTGVAHGQEAAPIVANNTMFVVAPCQNKLCALDLFKPGTPLQWSYNPSPIARREGRPVHNEVFVGDGGGEFGIRGWLAALDTKDGKVLWQAYNAGPDKDMLIGARFNAHDPVCFSLARDAGMALASSATIVISGSALLIATEG